MTTPDDSVLISVKNYVQVYILVGHFEKKQNMYKFINLKALSTLMNLSIF